MHISDKSVESECRNDFQVLRRPLHLKNARQFDMRLSTVMCIQAFDAKILERG